jgi:hypothetical protein
MPFTFKEFYLANIALAVQNILQLVFSPSCDFTDFLAGQWAKL